MSKLDELLRELCPNGVEYKALNEIGTMVRGSGLQKKDFVESGVGCIHYGQIYTYYGTFTDKTKSFVTPELAKKLQRVKKGDLVIAVTSENIEDVCKCVAWLGDEDIVAGGHSAIFKHTQDPKYLSYCFQTKDFFAQKKKIANGTKVIEVHPEKLSKVVVPVPPLPVQSEIVQILDHLAELTSEFTAELAAELTARREQYAYYSKRVISNTVDAVFTPISALGKWRGGKTPAMSVRKYWEGGTIPWISSKDMKAATLIDTQDHVTQAAISEAGMSLLPANSIVMVTRSGILKHTLPIAYIPFETTVNQDIKALVVKNGLLSRYVVLMLQTYADDIRNRAKKNGGTVDSLDFQKVLDFKIPVPPLPEQERVVAILDRFEALCNEIFAGLPAEIEARKKQYEYYRDKLLTFKEVTAE